MTPLGWCITRGGRVRHYWTHEAAPLCGAVLTQARVPTVWRKACSRCEAALEVHLWVERELGAA